METWYRVRKYDNEITPVEVEKSSAHFLWVETKWNGRSSVNRCEKVTQDTRYFGSYDQAKFWLLDRLANEIAALTVRLQEARTARFRLLGEKEENDADV
jgi:hypothetical protein